MIGERVIAALIADESKENFPRQVKGAHFSFVHPQKFDKGEVIHFNEELAKELRIDTEEHSRLVDVFLGKEHVKSFAYRYGGHQFGNWAGQLGDGRAINLGDVKRPDGKSVELQIKGGGLTPYSRTADGYAVLRSSIREYLCSEAMFYLGIPTTRALAILNTNEPVLRDMMYDGRAAYEPGAIVCRVADSFVRFGHFEILASNGELGELRQLLDFCLKEHHPDLPLNDEGYCTFFERVCNATCDMVIGWMRVGFVHGVMNTDNMSILGDTIDYGPYGWIDNLDMYWTPNTTDLPGRRYAFCRQPQIAQWNILKLANAIAVILSEPMLDNLKTTISSFATRYEKGFVNMMRSKLGLKIQKTSDEALINNLQNLLQEGEFDMTIFYRQLAKFTAMDQIDGLFESASYADEVSEDMKSWLHEYLNRCQEEPISQQHRAQQMNAVNPKYILRNYIAQLIIEDAHKGKFDLFHQMYSMIQRPYDEQPEMQEWFALRPDWAKSKVGCSMLSCSS